jgi:Fe-Mn family superoxide dismutase
VWLCKDGDRLTIVPTSNAGCPLTMKMTPLLTCDVWEHAYYIDYKSERAKYIEAWWKLVNWDFANKNLQARS